MKEDNVVREKSYAFAVRVVNVCRHLSEKKSEYVLSKQLLRSGTSVGANVEEAIGGQSEKDFFAKGLLRKRTSSQKDFFAKGLLRKRTSSQN